MSNCCHFPISVLGQVCCLIVLIPDSCPLSYVQYVQASCKVHKSKKLENSCNCTQSNVFFLKKKKLGRYLRETIPFGFHLCLLAAGTGPNSVARRVM